MLGGVHVEHELDQGPVQAGQGTAQDDEARPGELGAGIEVHPTPLGAEVDVVLGHEGEARRFAPAPLLAVVRLVAAVRDIGMGQIGQTQRDLGDLVLDGRQRLFEALRRDPRSSTSASKGAMSCPAALALPTALERALR